jgi:hypothetical protein
MHSNGTARGRERRARSKLPRVVVPSDRTTFKKKPLLVRRGPKDFFVEDARRAAFESLPGKRWEKDAHAHFCAGAFFTVDADGTCRACRQGGTCRPVRVKVLDITNSPKPRGVMIAKGVRPDAPTYRAERREFIAQLPADLASQLAEAENKGLLSPEARQALDEIVRRPWRAFRKRVEWINPDGKRVALDRIASWQRIGEDRDEPAKMIDEVRRLLANAKQRYP